ncbi:MAG: hypothetical protein QXL24_08060 [Candidatus Jordarchaeaceae archaeon]
MSSGAPETEQKAYPPELLIDIVDNRFICSGIGDVKLALLESSYATDLYTKIRNTNVYDYVREGRDDLEFCMNSIAITWGFTPDADKKIKKLSKEYKKRCIPLRVEIDEEDINEC